MEFKSLNELSLDIYDKILPNLPRDIGIVYGIPRSGMIPASIIATAIGTKLGTLGESTYFGERERNVVLPKGKKILIVDDSIHTGKAMQKALELLQLDKSQYYTCVIYAHSKSAHLIDFYAKTLDKGRIFQWNFSGIGATKNFCWDLDGVICTDPKVYDDDGEKYRLEIVEGVKPLILPQVKIKAIITNRIERWRNETETWLKQYGVQYEHLIMQPYSTAVERRLKSTSEEFKANNFLSLKGSIFIESHDKIAEKIHILTNHPVLSIESMKLFGS